MCDDVGCDRAKAETAEGCRCPGSRLERFIQPCLLLLLREEPTHGYALLASVSDIGWLESIDPGALYRTLRRLEEDGLVASQWDTAGSGPARRQYRITSDGEAVLAAWMDEIRHNIKLLQSFVSRFESGKP